MTKNRAGPVNLADIILERGTSHKAGVRIGEEGGRGSIVYHAGCNVALNFFSLILPIFSGHRFSPPSSPLASIAAAPAS